MSRKTPEFTSTISIRLTDPEKENLDNLCETLNITKSELLRQKVFTINKTIKITNIMKNLNHKEATEKALQELTGKKHTILSEKQNETQTPFSTTEEIITQLKNRNNVGDQ